MQTKHTILLIQHTRNRNSRTYVDFPSVSEAINSIIAMYETELKKHNPLVVNISYTVDDIVNWVNTLGDVIALVWEPDHQAYLPHDRVWVARYIRRFCNRM
ncbi:hypothetical protein P9112_010292 [Eukaryota sp. TZLM1-RC]